MDQAIRPLECCGARLPGPVWPAGRGAAESWCPGRGWGGTRTCQPRLGFGCCCQREPTQRLAQGVGLHTCSAWQRSERGAGPEPICRGLPLLAALRGAGFPLLLSTCGSVQWQEEITACLPVANGGRGGAPSRVQGASPPPCTGTGVGPSPDGPCTWALPSLHHAQACLCTAGVAPLPHAHRIRNICSLRFGQFVHAHVALACLATRQGGQAVVHSPANQTPRTLPPGQALASPPPRPTPAPPYRTSALHPPAARSCMCTAWLMRAYRTGTA